MNFEKDFEYIYTNINQGVVLQDKDGHIIDANRAAEEILGLSIAQMQGMDSFDPKWHAIKEDMSPFDGDEHPAMVALRTKQKVTNVLMGVYNTQQNSYKWISIDAIPKIENGEVLGVFSIFTDITKLQNYKDQIEEHNKHLKQLVSNEIKTNLNNISRESLIFDNLPFLLAHINSELIYQYVNISYEKFFKKPKKYFYQKSVSDVLGDVLYSKLISKIEAVLKGELTEIYIDDNSDDNKRFILSGFLIPFYEYDNIQNGYIVVVEDITEKIIFDERYKQQEAELIQQSKMATMGTMISAIAHQWKQPLSIISLYAQDLPEMYQYNELNENSIKDISTKMLDQIKYMSETITDFRNFFKPSQNIEQFDIKSAISGVRNLIENQLLHNNINMHLDIEDIIVTGYINDFKQLILNIIANSKDAIVEKKIQKGILEIVCKKVEEKIILEISDNGGGIDESLLPNKIFEPYVSTKGEKGTGIGLMIVKSIVEQKMNGTIIASNIDNGARFTITFAQTVKDK